MISKTSPRFWNEFRGLPQNIQRLAYLKYQLWQDTPDHASLRFKRLKGHDTLWSVRIGDHYRALGYYETRDLFVWTWIGTHEEYNKIISR